MHWRLDSGGRMLDIQLACAPRAPGMYRVTRLENGLTVATAEMPHTRSVSVGIWVGVGSRYEPAELNGACHFIEHLVFKGTKHRSAVRAARRYARHFARGQRPPFAPSHDEQTAPRVCLFSKRTEQTQIALGIRTCSRHDPRRYPLRLLNTILGENMSSRLFQVIREDLGLAYSIYSNPSFFEDTGDLVISAGLDTNNLEKVLKLILVELRRMSQKLPSVGEVRRARDYVIGQMQLSLESTDNRMNWIGEQLLSYGLVMSPDEIKRRLSAVTASRIRDVARDFFRQERLNLALVSPLKSDRRLSGLF